MFKNICFESERLITRQLGDQDAESLFQFYSDAEAMKFRASKPMKSMVDAHKMVEERWVANDQISKLRLGIWNKAANHLVGTLLLTLDQTQNQQCEIGFSFGKDHWRKGYGKETLQMVETELSNHKNIQSIKAWCIRENLASVRIFKNAGFAEIEQKQYSGSRLFVKSL